MRRVQAPQAGDSRRHFAARAVPAPCAPRADAHVQRTGRGAEQLRAPRPRQAHLHDWRLLWCDAQVHVLHRLADTQASFTAALLPLPSAEPACRPHADGEWRNNVRHGRGVAVFTSGLRYEGTWKDDKTEGMGVCVYANGDKARAAS